MNQTVSKRKSKQLRVSPILRGLVMVICLTVGILAGPSESYAFSYINWVRACNIAFNVCDTGADLAAAQACTLYLEYCTAH